MNAVMSDSHFPRRKRQARLVPRVKVWVECGGRYAFGFGLAEILQALERTGSFKQAASDLGKSYRYIWGRIKEAEKVLGRQLVLTQVGGKEQKRSFLTPTARQLVTNFLSLRGRLTHLVEQEFARHFTWPLRSEAEGSPVPNYRDQDS
jgi:molybdate transport repressor ModE-like protein